MGGAEWEYIAANLRKTGRPHPRRPRSWIKDFGDVQVGFVGAVTEDLPSLVSPDGIADIEVTDIVTAVNESADALEGRRCRRDRAPRPRGCGRPRRCASATDPNSAFGRSSTASTPTSTRSSPATLTWPTTTPSPVPAWVTEGRAVTDPSGRLGRSVRHVPQPAEFTVDTATGEILDTSQNVLNLKAQTAPFASNYPVDPAVTPIVNDAIAQADVLGAVELGKIAAPFNRAKLANGTTENRGGESTLGNLVAEVQRWATRLRGGWRADRVHEPGRSSGGHGGQRGTGIPRTLTYKQAAVSSRSPTPWSTWTDRRADQDGPRAAVAARCGWQHPDAPVPELGTSKGFNYTYDPSRPEGDRIPGCGSTARRSARPRLLGHGQLVPGVGW